MVKDSKRSKRLTVLLYRLELVKSWRGASN